MNLVFDSSSSLGMNCVVNFVCCYADSPISGSFKPSAPASMFRRWTSSYMDVPSTVSSSSRMSTRRLPVITLCFSFECTLYPVMFCLVCLWWPRRLVINLRLPTYHDDFFKVFSLLSSSRHLHRLSNNLAARDLLGLWYSLIILLH